MCLSALTANLLIRSLSFAGDTRGYSAAELDQMVLDMEDSLTQK
jgi:predicted methyltransferase MtxX (methanogen marker protein 4)